MDRLADRERANVAGTLYKAILDDDQTTLVTRAPKRRLRWIHHRGRSLLAWACCHGRTKIALWLVEQGADPSAVDACGWSVLKQAVHRGDAFLVRSLIDAGGDPHHGRLLWAAWLEGHTNVYRTLVEYGVHDPSIPIEDHDYLLQGKPILRGGGPLTNPPVPLYAPVTRLSYLRAAVKLIIRSATPRHLLTRVRQWLVYRSREQHAAHGM